MKKKRNGYGNPQENNPEDLNDAKYIQLICSGCENRDDRLSRRELHLIFQQKFKKSRSETDEIIKILCIRGHLLPNRKGLRLAVTCSQCGTKNLNAPLRSYRMFESRWVCQKCWGRVL